MHAARYGYTQCISILLGHGSDINTVDSCGRTPLALCTWFGHTEAALRLIDNGANITYQDGCGRTPLHIAAWFGRNEILDKLLELKADVNSSDSQKNTPLHLAVYNNRKDIVEKLLEHGADTQLKNAEDKTVYAIAESDNMADIIKSLQKKDDETWPRIDKKHIKEQKKILNDLKTVTDDYNAGIKKLRDLTNYLDDVKKSLTTLSESQTAYYKGLDTASRNIKQVYSTATNQGNARKIQISHTRMNQQPSAPPTGK